MIYKLQTLESLINADIEGTIEIQPQTPKVQVAGVDLKTLIYFGLFLLVGYLFVKTISNDNK
jgi:hypothetical protein